MDTCWFCEQRPAAHDTAFRAAVYGKLDDPPPAGGRRIEHRHDSSYLIVPIPRCSSCRGRQRRETALALSGLTLGVVAFAAPYAYAAFVRGSPPFTLFGSATAACVALAVIGFIVGLLAGVVVAARINRGAPRRDARNHPDVVNLTNAGWSYDPPGAPD